jgi:membrane protease YdiL (CAAX protease family)
MAVIFEGGLLVLAWGLGHLLGVPVGEQTVLATSAFVLGVVATVPLLAGLYWILHTPWGVVARLRVVIEDQVAPLFAGGSVAGIAVISILAGVGEEALFRGVLQSAIAASIGVVPALLVVSTLFGLVHPVTAVYAVMAGLIGLYLGVLTIWTGTLVPAMTAHGLYDFVALTYLVRSGRVSGNAATGDGSPP